MRDRKEIYKILQQWEEAYNDVWELIKTTNESNIRDGYHKAAKELKVKIDLLRWVLNL